VQAAAAAAMKAFEDKTFDAVEVIYSEFKNAASQEYKAEAFLPIPKVKSTGTTKKIGLYF